MKVIVNFAYRRAGWLRWLWAGIIFLLCSMPGEFIPANNWLELLSVDKLVHALIFFILCSLFLLYDLQKKKAKGRWLLILITCVLYGMSLEWMQATFFRNRSADWFDVIANTFGCVLAAAVNQWYDRLTRDFISRTG